MNITKSQLTDEQCDEFRRFNGSFNDMVRHIYERGRQSGSAETAQQERERCAKVCESENDPWAAVGYQSGVLDCAKAIRAIEQGAEGRE